MERQKLVRNIPCTDENTESGDHPESDDLELINSKFPVRLGDSKKRREVTLITRKIVN